MLNKKIVVLGAGPAGLTAAWILSKHGSNVEVIEKEPRVGGMSASFRWKDYILDYGPHAYHTNKNKIDEIVRSLCKEDLKIKKRREKMLIRGKYFGYPLQFWEVVFGLNPFFSIYMVSDFIYTTIRNKLSPMPEESFEDWGIKSFGRTLYDLCFGKYTNKIWGMPASRLSSKLFTQKIHRLNLKDIIIKLLGGRGTEQLTYWKDFLYPEEGIGEIFQKMQKDIIRNGGKINLNSDFVKLNLIDDKADTIIYKKHGKDFVAKCDYLLSSIPVNKLALSINSYSDSETINSAKNLKFRSLIIVYLVFNKPQITDVHWIYLLDGNFRSNRFCEQKNLGERMCADGKTILGFEICCNKNDELWNSSNERLFELILEDVDKFDIMDRRDILDYYVTKIDDAYPIYDLEFDTNLKKLFNRLSKIDHLLSFGRQGLFLNNDIHDSMYMGLLASRFVEDGNRNGKEWYKDIEFYLDSKFKLKDR